MTRENISVNDSNKASEERWKTFEERIERQFQNFEFQNNMQIKEILDQIEELKGQMVVKGEQ